jgi:hypothetical protein
MEKEKEVAPEASEPKAPAEDSQPAAPAEEKEAEKISEEIDPRVVSLVGEEEVKNAFGEKPKEVPAEEKKEVPEEEQKKDQEEKPGEEVELPKINPPEYKPTRLDRRLANAFIHNLHLSGEKEIPTEDEIISDLKKYSKDEKVQALHFHRLKGKELRGEKPSEDNLDDEDRAAIQDEEREAMRKEIQEEEHQKTVMNDFIKFVSDHTELLPEIKDDKGVATPNKKFDPVLAKAVETLWKGGMKIDEAYETVTAKIQEVKEAKEKEEKNEKDKALSGVLSGTGQIPQTGKDITWEDAAKIEKEDPQKYRKMLKEGKFKHLME